MTPHLTMCLHIAGMLCQSTGFPQEVHWSSSTLQWVVVQNHHRRRWKTDCSQERPDLHHSRVCRLVLRICTTGCSELTEKILNLKEHVRTTCIQLDSQLCPVEDPGLNCFERWNKCWLFAGWGIGGNWKLFSDTVVCLCACCVCVCVCVWGGGGVACHMMCLLSIPVAAISAHCVCVSLPAFFCLLSVSADLSRFVLALYLSFWCCLTQRCVMISPFICYCRSAEITYVGDTVQRWTVSAAVCVPYSGKNVSADCFLYFVHCWCASHTGIIQDALLRWLHTYSEFCYDVVLWF